MTFASAIRFAAPLLLTVILAGCVLPYDDGPYYGGSTYYGRPHYGGDVYAVDPFRPHRTHRRDRRGSDGDIRHRRRAHERWGLEERHRRDRAGRRATERRARRAERQAQERDPAPRRYHDQRGSDETDAASARRVERAERQAERESSPLQRVARGGAQTQR